MGNRVILRIPKHPRHDECPYEQGCEYMRALPTLTGQHRIRIDSITRQRLALVTFVEAKRELGHHRSQSAWRAAWVRRFDKAWCRRPPQLGQASDADCARRFSQHWSTRDAWVLEFVLVEGAPLLLATQGAILAGQTGNGEYTSTRHKSIDPDVEAVDAATLTRFVADELGRRADRREPREGSAKERKRDRGSALRRQAGDVV